MTTRSLTVSWRLLRTSRRVLAAVVVVAALFASGRVTLHARQATALEERLTEVRNSLQVRDYAEAIRRATELVAQVNASALSQGAKKILLAEALLVRAQAYFFNNDLERAKTDLRQMFSANPAQRLDTAIPRLVAALDEARRTVVGSLQLRVVPPDSEVRLEGEIVADHGAPIELAAGNYTVSVSRRSYEAKQQQVYVVAGESTTLEVPLTRLSSTAIVVTAPSGVIVSLDDAPAGRTPDGPAPLAYQQQLQELGVNLSGASAPLELADIPAGNHLLKFERPCFVSRTVSFPAGELNDYMLAPIKLERAVGTIRFAGDAGDVFLDGEARGQVTTLSDICEGRHTIEVLSPTGRYVETVDVATGSARTVTASVRPGVAIVGVTGLPETYRGPDHRLQLGQAFERTGLTVFAPPATAAATALDTEQLSAGWLSTPPAGFTPAARHDVSLRLAQSLRVQAVAEVHVPDVSATSTVDLSILAAGSARADRITIPLGDPPARDALLKALDSIPPMFSYSIGVELADVYTSANVPAVAVVGVDEGGAAAAAGITAGDVIAQVNGQNVATTAAVLALLSSAKDGQSVTLDLRDDVANLTSTKRVTLKVAARPAVVAFEDETLYPNRLIVEYRRRLAQAAPGLDSAVLHLNLGVALMKVGSWSDAEAELKQVSLGGGPGVSAGTVQFLLGQCYRQLGRPAEMRAAFDLAAKATGAQLTVNGPLISELVKKELEQASKN